MQLQKHFHLQEWAIDNWPFWLLEENVRLVNELIEEEESNHKKQEKEQQMPNYDGMMKNASNFGKDIGNFQMPKF